MLFSKASKKRGVGEKGLKHLKNFREEIVRKCSPGSGTLIAGFRGSSASSKVLVIADFAINCDF
jgi:hypothetical protein